MVCAFHNVQYVDLLWALLTVRTILTVGLDPEVSHPVSNLRVTKIAISWFHD